jgi:hypothetical protein
MSGATIAMGTQKITGLGNGSATTDAAAYGQMKVLQYVTVTTTTGTSTSSSTYQSTNLTLNITPSSVSSKVYVMAFGAINNASPANTIASVALFNGSTNLMAAIGEQVLEGSFSASERSLTMCKRFFKTVILAAGLLLAVGSVHAAQVAYSGVFVGTEGLASSTGAAISSNYTRNINTTGDRISFQLLYSSYSVAVSTNFGSGQYTLNTPTITITSNKFTTGLQVLYSSAGANVISGLTDQTTYFISLLSANNLGVSNRFLLSTTLANAQAGTGIVLASSSSATNRFTLAPLAFTNTGGGGAQLQSSDDGNNWTNLTTGTMAWRFRA